MTDERVRAALTAISDGAVAATQESEILDFKTVGRSRDDALENLAEAATCFANAQGGCLVVGVRDRMAGDRAFEDVDLDIARTQHRIYELTAPSLIVSVDAITWAGRRLLVVEVPRSPDVHQFKGRAVERIGTSCMQMSAARIAAVVSERRGDDWSADPSSVRGDSASSRALEDARGLLSALPDPERARWAALSTADLLRRLGVVDPHGYLTNGGALLFADDRRPLANYAYRRSRSGELVINQFLAGPGLPAILRCIELVDARLERTPINLPNGQQLLVADLPDPAVREAILNAFMHRSYQDPASVQIEHAPGRLAVTSPGAFVLGVTPENILTVSSRSRNASLTTVIRHLGLAETAGVGVDRMYAEMARLGHVPPDFDSDRYRVCATLHGGVPNGPLARFVATLPSDRQSDPDTLLVLVTLLSSRTVTAIGLSPLLQKPAAEVEEVLLHLSELPVELVERTRESAHLRAGVYRLRAHALAGLGTAVRYRRRSGDDADRKIVEIVREVGRINGKVVRTLLDVDTPAASRILGMLVESGVLVKTSQAQRGPSVTYGPGPKFPRRMSRRASGASASVATSE